MEEVELTCNLENESVVFSRDLLMKQICEFESLSLDIPEHISLADLNLYANFLSSGYLEFNSFFAIFRILAVADFFSQKNICTALLSSIILPNITYKNCLFILTQIEIYSDEIYAQIVEKCSYVIAENFNLFKDMLNELDESILESIFELLYGNHEFCCIILEALKFKCECNSYAELLIYEENRISERNVNPEVEYNWKVNLSENEELQSEKFEAFGSQIWMTLKNRENLEIYVEDDKKILGLCRGLAIYQGTSTYFYYLNSSGLVKLSETSQKTSTACIKIVLQSSNLLYSILLKALNEIEETGKCGIISKACMKLIISALKIKNDEEKTLKLIAEWCECSPDFIDSEIFGEYNWRSKNLEELSNISNQFPIFQENENFQAELKLRQNRKECQKKSFFSNSSADPFFGEEKIGEQTPEESSIVLDISYLQTPSTTEKRNLKPIISQNELSVAKHHKRYFSSSEQGSPCKHNEINQKYNTPSKFSKKGVNLTSLELILALKNKLINTKPDRKFTNVLKFTHPLLYEFHSPSLSKIDHF